MLLVRGASLSLTQNCRVEKTWQTQYHVFVEGFEVKPVPVSFDYVNNLELPEKGLSVEGWSRPDWSMDVFMGHLLTID